ATYEGDANNNSASDQGGTAEQTVVTPASPVLTTAAGTNELINGGFEQPAISGFNTFFPSIPGWALAPGTGGGSIELEGPTFVGTPFEGNQFVEMNSKGP